MRGAGVLLGMVLLAAAPAAAEPKTEAEVLETLARVILLRDKCPRSRLNLVQAGLLMSQAGITDRTLIGRHREPFFAAVSRLEAGIEAMSEAEACEAFFELYGKNGRLVAGLAVEPHPDDFLNFIDKLAEGFGALRNVFGRKSRTP